MAAKERIDGEMLASGSESESELEREADSERTELGTSSNDARLSFAHPHNLVHPTVAPADSQPHSNRALFDILAPSQHFSLFPARYLFIGRTTLSRR